VAFNNRDYEDNTPFQLAHSNLKKTYLNRIEVLIYRYDDTM